MAIWGKLFGSESVINAGISAGDALVFTKEEKAEHFLKIMKAYEPFKLAQRLLAFMIVGIYLLVWLIAAILTAGAAFVDGQLGTMMLAAAQSLGASNNETLGMPTSLVVGFYFAGGTIEGAIGKWRGNKDD